ncbi:MAG: amidohydrolase family protein [Lachnospiraceae bacterium]|nr:amidohydrolase family protein [Lachnospiraceae bacterium]
MFGECHAHVFMNGYDYKEAVLRHKGHPDLSVAHTWFAAYQKAGIDFVRDGGDRYGVSEGARTFAMDYGIDYRSPIYAIHKNGYYGGIVGFGFDTIDEYKQLVDGVSAKHGDFIKIMASGILDFDHFGQVTTPLEDPDLIREMVRIAHEEGYAVMVHVNTPRQIRFALEAGCDTIEHGYYPDQDCLQLFRETGAIWVPTLATCSNLRGCGRFDEDNVRRITKAHMAHIRDAVRMGVLVGCGSDAGAYMVPHAQGTLDEVRLLEEACGPELKDRLYQSLAKSDAIIREKFHRH